MLGRSQRDHGDRFVRHVVGEIGPRLVWEVHSQWVFSRRHNVVDRVRTVHIAISNCRNRVPPSRSAVRTEPPLPSTLETFRRRSVGDPTLCEALPEASRPETSRPEASRPLPIPADRTRSRGSRRRSCVLETRPKRCFIRRSPTGHRANRTNLPRLRRTHPVERSTGERPRGHRTGDRGRGREPLRKSRPVPVREL